MVMEIMRRPEQLQEAQLVVQFGPDGAGRASWGSWRECRGNDNKTWKLSSYTQGVLKYFSDIRGHNLSSDETHHHSMGGQHWVRTTAWWWQWQFWSSQHNTWWPLGRQKQDTTLPTLLLTSLLAGSALAAFHNNTNTCSDVKLFERGLAAPFDFYLGLFLGTISEQRY